MHPILLILIFILSILVGYKLIKNVPSRLHTPLMSGMNALSGVTVLGSLAATAAAVRLSSQALGYAAIFLAMLNVAGGFGVTHRMLRMFRRSGAGSSKHEPEGSYLELLAHASGEEKK